MPVALAIFIDFSWQGFFAIALFLCHPEERRLDKDACGNQDLNKTKSDLWSLRCSE